MLFSRCAWKNQKGILQQTYILHTIHQYYIQGQWRLRENHRTTLSLIDTGYYITNNFDQIVINIGVFID